MQKAKSPLKILFPKSIFWYCIIPFPVLSYNKYIFEKLVFQNYVRNFFLHNSTIVLFLWNCDMYFPTTVLLIILGYKCWRLTSSNLRNTWTNMLSSLKGNVLLSTGSSQTFCFLALSLLQNIRSILNCLTSQNTKHYHDYISSHLYAI